MDSPASTSPHLPMLQEIFREVFDQPGLVIAPDTTPETVEDWDSVAQVKLVLAVEDAFDIRLSTDEVSTIHSVGDFLTSIERHR